MTKTFLVRPMIGTKYKLGLGNKGSKKSPQLN